MFGEVFNGSLFPNNHAELHVSIEGVVGQVGAANDGDVVHNRTLHVQLADGFACAEQRRRALKLLQREQAQRVTHQHGDAVVAGAAFDVLLQPAQGEHIGGEAKIGFRLAAAGREPKQIRDGVGLMAAVGMVKARDTRQVEQNERELEDTPRPVLRHIKRFNGRADYNFLFADFSRVGGMDTLLPHCLVGKPKRILRKRVVFNEVNPLRDANASALAAFDCPLRRGLMFNQPFGGIGSFAGLLLNPTRVGIF